MIDFRDIGLAVLTLIILWLLFYIGQQKSHINDLNTAFDQYEKVIEVFADLGDACIAHKDQVERLEGTINELLTGDH